MRVLVAVDIDPTVPYEMGSYDGPCEDWNVGNSIFCTAACSYFANRGGCVHTFADILAHLADDADWGVRNFDCVVMPQACIIAAEGIPQMCLVTDIAQRLKLKTYLLGVGIQWRFDEKCGVGNPFAECAKRMISVIYGSGGEMTVRGEVTRDFCRQLGVDCRITGCTSVFMRGSEFRMATPCVPIDRFNVAFNGIAAEDIPATFYSEARKSYFIDQDLYSDLLYRPNALDDDALKHMVSARMCELYRAGINGEARLVLWPNIPSWCEFFQRKQIAFSYGERMHGNVLAMLNHVPCFIKARDYRVMEMVRFYKIPSSISVDFDDRKDSLYDLYKSLSWEEFNAAYKTNYANFTAFLDGIAPIIDDRRIDFPPFPMDCTRHPSYTREVLDRCLKSLRRRKLHAWHFMMLDILTFGCNHTQYAKKYEKYFEHV